MLQDLVPVFRNPHEVILEIENRVRVRAILNMPILPAGGAKVIA
jgi:hypothetical protein